MSCSKDSPQCNLLHVPEYQHIKTYQHTFMKFSCNGVLFTCCVCNMSCVMSSISPGMDTETTIITTIIRTTMTKWKVLNNHEIVQKLRHHMYNINTSAFRHSYNNMIQASWRPYELLLSFLGLKNKTGNLIHAYLYHESRNIDPTIFTVFNFQSSMGLWRAFDTMKASNLLASSFLKYVNQQCWRLGYVD